MKRILRSNTRRSCQAKSPRICVVCHRPLEWPTLAVYQRILYLSQRYEVVVLTRVDTPVPDEIQRVARVVRAPWSVGMLYPNYLLFYVWLPFALVWLYRAWPFDCIHTQEDLSCVFGALARRYLNLPWIVDVLDDPALESSKHRILGGVTWKSCVQRAILYMVSKCLRHADLVVTIGTRPEEGLPAVLARDYSVLPSRILAVPNGVDLNTYVPKELAQHGAFSIFYVGSIGTLQGTRVLLEAFDALRELSPGTHLVLAGPYIRRERSGYEREFEIRGDAVEYLGPTHPDQVRNFIAKSSVCVYPFLSVPANEVVYPLKVCEYLAMGKPVIASRLEGVSRVLTDEYDGLLVEPGDPKALCDALLRLASDPNLCERLSHHARESAEEFDWSHINAAIGRRMDRVLVARPSKRL